MEITKQNEIYQISDSTEKYNISGSLNINLDNSYSFNISMTDANNSKTMSYYKTVTSDHIDVNYNAPKDSEEDLLNYIKDNMQVILDKVNKLGINGQSDTNGIGDSDKSLKYDRIVFVFLYVPIKSISN